MKEIKVSFKGIVRTFSWATFGSFNAVALYTGIHVSWSLFLQLVPILLVGWIGLSAEIIIESKILKGLASFLKVKFLRLRNIFLTPEEREEWLGDLRETVNHMWYVEKRSKAYIKWYVFNQHRLLGLSKLEILLFRIVSRIIGG